MFFNNSNKIKRRQIPFEDGLQLANSHGMLFFETSALNGSNINMVWEFK